MMVMLRPMNLYWIALAALLLGPMVCSAAQAGDLKAFFRSGQTFITWKESGAGRYNLYRSKTPIADLKSAQFVATIAKGSSTYHSEIAHIFESIPTHWAATTTGQEGYGCRYIIQDNPTADPSGMLGEDVGLFVYTAHQAGDFYYAIAAVGEDAVPDASLSPANSLAKAIGERVEPIGAVCIFERPSKDKEGHVVGIERLYTHWMDASAWNGGPTGGYAFNFGLAIADKGGPVMLRLHARACRYELHSPMQGMTTIILDDPLQSWWYGYRNAEGSAVENYTERRVFLTLDFVLRTLAQEGRPFDADRVYVHGNSMGGSGANFLGAWHGRELACVYTNKGVMDFNRQKGSIGDATERLWDSPQRNLPTNQGDKVWDHMNVIRWHKEHVGQETPFFIDTHAGDDKSVISDYLGEYYLTLQQAKRPFAANWSLGGHSADTPIPKTPNFPGLDSQLIRRNQSVPAIGFASSNDDPSQPAGQINGKIEWSSPTNHFAPGGSKATDIVDEPGRWEMSFRSLAGAGAQTAMITPRRCQKFKPAPGTLCHWQNVSHADPAKPAVVAQGDVQADQYGLVSVEKFQFDAQGWGNKLIITVKG